MNEFPNRLVAAILAAWFCFALALGLSRAFESANAAMVVLTVWGLTAIVLLPCWKIEMLRDWVGALPLRRLISVHLVRFVGIYFLVLASKDRLPAGFAKPAGIGDIIIALGAVALLAMPTFRASVTFVRFWNFFGFIDIIFVVFSALRFGLADWESMAALRRLPLSLLPTFFVPLIIASHVLIFVRIIAPAKEP